MAILTIGSDNVKLNDICFLVKLDKIVLFGCSFG